MKSEKVTKCLFCVYLAGLAWVILFKLQVSFSSLPGMRNLNLIPFGGSTIINGRVDFDEILNNLFVFVPYGIFTGMLWKEKAFLKKIAPAFFTSLAFEAAQFIFAIGASDITDVLMNTAGGAAGIGGSMLMSKVFKDKAQRILNTVCLIGAALLFSFIGFVLIVSS